MNKGLISKEISWLIAIMSPEMKLIKQQMFGENKLGLSWAKLMLNFKFLCLIWMCYESKLKLAFNSDDHLSFLAV